VISVKTLPMNYGLKQATRIMQVFLRRPALLFPWWCWQSLAVFFLIKNNYRAFQLNNVIIIFGFLVTALATFLFHLKVISPVIWIVCAASGLYLGYVPYNCFYFERMLAAYKVPGNVGFVIYIADAFGYLGTVVVLLVKEFISIKYSWVDFFTWIFYISACGGILLVLWGSTLFAKIYRNSK
jgi:hypothetical protein